MVFGEPKTHKAVVPLTIFGLFATFQDPNYSFQSCVLSWVAKEAGCHLDWFRSDRLRWKPSCRKQYFSKSPINGVAPCSRVEDITSYQNALSKALLVSCSHLLQHLLTSCFFLFERRAGWSSARWPAVCPSVLSGLTFSTAGAPVHNVYFVKYIFPHNQTTSNQS